MIRLEDFPNPQRRALEIVREVAAEKDCRPYLVGGPVRDVLLGRNDVLDVDITLAELSIESFFPADPSTAATLRAALV